MTCGSSRAFGLPALVLSGVLAAGSPVADARAVGADAQAAAKGAKTSSKVALNTRVTLPGASGAVGTRSTSILGTAWEADNTPIPNARLRLRNVLSGKIAATTTANEMGQFAFNDIESSSYLVELVGGNGKILTVGHTFTVAPGETVATFVRLGTRVPWFNGFFGNAASAVAATAASTGITAVAPEAIRCVSNCG